MLDFGEDGSGLFMKYLRRGSGYYIDVGASDLIAEGKIKRISNPLELGRQRESQNPGASLGFTLGSIVIVLDSAIAWRVEHLRRDVMPTS
jgi:putative flavoprotein involved in K+ transport